MVRSNENYAKIPGNYLFAEIARKVAAHKEANPDKKVISLGIGDVTHPLIPTVIAAMHKAVDEMGQSESFRGYGPEQGYAFLREAIVRHDYAPRNLSITAEDIFISDGSKCDVGNFQELFAADAKVAVTDPVYPVYVDSNAMAGRAGNWTGSKWDNLIYLPCTKDNAFVPDFPKETPDIIYLCYPNNPTGTVLCKDALGAWVEYARKVGAVILFDSAYEAYVTEENIPHSIYEVPGAEEVAVEFRSFSKTAGFTGTRCAYVVVPKALRIAGPDGNPVFLQAMWNRRQATKFNGCSYIVQRGAEAIYTLEGQELVSKVVNSYMANAAKIRKGVQDLGLETFGGVNAPYIWVRTPEGLGSWDFFERLLSQTSLVCTPGAGFGPSGEGYVRLTAFGTATQTEEALKRLAALDA